MNAHYQDLLAFATAFPTSSVRLQRAVGLPIRANWTQGQRFNVRSRQRCLKRQQYIASLPPQQPGYLRFSCGMGMYGGVIQIS